MVKNWDRDGRLICCHGNSRIEHEPIYQCWGCGNYWHKSCGEKRGQCCKDRGLKLQFMDSIHFMEYNSIVSFNTRGERRST